MIPLKGLQVKTLTKISTRGNAESKFLVFNERLKSFTSPTTLGFLFITTCGNIFICLQLVDYKYQQAQYCTYVEVSY